MAEMTRSRKSGFAVTKLEADIHARREAGASHKQIAQEMGLSESYVSQVSASARRKLEANARLAARPKRIDFLK